MGVIFRGDIHFWLLLRWKEWKWMNLWVLKKENILIPEDVWRTTCPCLSRWPALSDCWCHLLDWYWIINSKLRTIQVQPARFSALHLPPPWLNQKLHFSNSQPQLSEVAPCLTGQVKSNWVLTSRTFLPGLTSDPPDLALYMGLLLSYYHYTTIAAQQICKGPTLTFFVFSEYSTFCLCNI